MNQITLFHLALGNLRVAGCMVLVAFALSGWAKGNQVDGQPAEVEAQAVSYVGDMSSCDAGCCDGSCGGQCGNCGNGCGGGCGGGLFGCNRCMAGVVPRAYGRPDLFYNFYTQGYANQVNAQMYLSPLPIPPNVGHTFYTYQPFYPHHMLYWHKDKFHRYYDNGRGMNRTRATYYSPPIRSAAKSLYWNFLRIPR
jgi:hypothetical protein